MSQTKCKGCGKLFAKRASDRNTYCTSNCKGVTMAERWRPCATCMASIGLTASMASKLLGIISRPQVTRYWRDNCPDRDSSSVIAAQKAHRRRIKSEITSKTTRQITYAKAHREYVGARMKDIKASSRGFDWTYLWYKEMARLHSLRKYRGMTDQERKEYNRDAIKKRDKEKAAQANRKWRKANKQHLKEYGKMWRRDNKEKRSKYYKKPENRVIRNLRKRLRTLTRSARSGGSAKSSSLIGCTTKQLKQHLESQFHSGMSWDNYGTRWHVDHIMPVSAFDQSRPEQRKVCWNFNNLQPLPAKDNIIKSNAITEPQLPLPLAI